MRCEGAGQGRRNSLILRNQEENQGDLSPESKKREEEEEKKKEEMLMD